MKTVNIQKLLLILLKEAFIFLEPNTVWTFVKWDIPVQSSHLCIISFIKYTPEKTECYYIKCWLRNNLAPLENITVIWCSKDSASALLFTATLFLSIVYSCRPGNPKKLKITCPVPDKKTSKEAYNSCRLIYIMKLFTQNMTRKSVFLFLCFFTVSVCDCNLRV